MWMNLSIIIMSEKSSLNGFHDIDSIYIIFWNNKIREKTVVVMETKKLREGAYVDGTVLYHDCSGSWMKLYV